MRRKITIGFLSLVGVLLFAGAISIFELNRLRDKSAAIIEQGAVNAIIAEKLNAALQMQNTAVIKMIISEYADPGQEFYEGMRIFNETVNEAAESIQNPEDLEVIRVASDVYDKTVDGYANESLDLDMEWFANSYLQSYYTLNTAINDFITSPQTSLAARATRLERSAYRTITPSILTLLVAIFIVLMFYFFVNNYYIKPVQRINNGVKRYLATRIPFDDSFETNDDIDELKKGVMELIEQAKRNR